MTGEATSSHEHFYAVTPYLCVKDGKAAIDFYKDVFGAVEVLRWHDNTGRVSHAELRFSGAPIFLADEFPEINVLSPQTLGGSPVSIHLVVGDVDAVAKQAVAAGATLLRPVADQSYGDRNCKLMDPFGHVWMIATPIANMSVKGAQEHHETTTK